MHQETIKQLVEEIATALNGRSLRNVFQLNSLSLAIDFGLREKQYLFMSVEPNRPRLYLISRQRRELQGQSTSPGPFAQALRATLGGGRLVSVTKDEDDRIVRFLFVIQDETGEEHRKTLMVQLTGRSANLFILDQDEKITHVMRTAKTSKSQLEHLRLAGQQPGEHYRPRRSLTKKHVEEDPLRRNGTLTISEVADHYYSQLETAERFAAQTKALRSSLSKEIAQRVKLKNNLKSDLTAQGNAEDHKRLGDLLLANLNSARREGRKVRLIDYYAEDEQIIEIEVDEHKSLKEEAARYFARYSKSKRAAEESRTRLAQIEHELTNLQEKQTSLDRLLASGDAAALNILAEGEKRPLIRNRKHERAKFLPGVRRYRSSDGYEILVGRAARDNDQLSFRIARPNDLWLHAADYPGSHVVVRNPERKEIPQRTITEAAQLAGKFSQASKDSRVVVHYTERKFLSKPKGAAPGRVRLSTFRSITVEPKESVDRM